MLSVNIIDTDQSFTSPSQYNLRPLQPRPDTQTLPLQETRGILLKPRGSQQIFISLE